MTDYSKMTHEEFVDILGQVMDEGPASALLEVPGVWECVSEHFNNEVLDRWAKAREEDAADEEESE